MEKKGFFQERKKRKIQIAQLESEGELEEIAEKYGIDAYKKSQKSLNRDKFKKAFFTRDGRKKIKDLRKNREYDEIFQTYGTSVFKIATPYKYRKQELDRLKKEGRFEDIYRKYGESTYNDYIYTMQMKEVEDVTGSKSKAILNRVKNVIQKRILPVFVSSLLLLPPATTVAIGAIMESEAKGNETEYSTQIETYNIRMNEYAQSVKNMKLSHIQNIMKVMDDMWRDIEGYGNPEIDAAGHYRIDFANPNGIGVCRNMADHVTYVLNQINPEYNARNLSVRLSNGGELANIERNIVEDDETVVESEQEEKKSTFMETAIETIIGNHLVTAMDVPGEKLTLIIDSTNPSIGVYRNGEITMFWSKEGKGIDLALVGNSIFNGSLGIPETMREVAKTFISTNKPIEELREKWGVEAQNKALEEVRKMHDLTKTQKSSSFDEKYKVTLEDKTQQLNNKNNIAKQDTQIERE